MKRIMLALVVGALGLTSVSSHAAGTEVADVRCRDVTPSTSRNGTCTTTFTLNGDPVHISEIEGTHANFLSPGTAGALTMKWRDAANAEIAVISCTGVATVGFLAPSIAILTDGALEPDAGFVCTVDLKSTTYAAGTQTLTVDAASARFNGATYWGRLVLTTEPDPV